MKPKSNVDFPILTKLKGDFFRNTLFFRNLHISIFFATFLTKPERAVAKARSAEPARVGFGKKISYRMVMTSDRIVLGI